MKGRSGRPGARRAVAVEQLVERGGVLLEVPERGGDAPALVGLAGLAVELRQRQVGVGPVGIVGDQLLVRGDRALARVGSHQLVDVGQHLLLGVVARIERHRRLVRRHGQLAIAELAHRHVRDPRPEPQLERAGRVRRQPLEHRAVAGDEARPVHGVLAQATELVEGVDHVGGVVEGALEELDRLQRTVHLVEQQPRRLAPQLARARPATSPAWPAPPASRPPARTGPLPCRSPAASRSARADRARPRTPCGRRPPRARGHRGAPRRRRRSPPRAGPVSGSATTAARASRSAIQPAQSSFAARSGASASRAARELGASAAASR